MVDPLHTRRQQYDGDGQPQLYKKPCGPARHERSSIAALKPTGHTHPFHTRVPEFSVSLTSDRTTDSRLHTLPDTHTINLVCSLCAVASVAAGTGYSDIVSIGNYYLTSSQETTTTALLHVSAFASLHARRSFLPFPLPHTHTNTRTQLDLQQTPLNTHTGRQNDDEPAQTANVA